jgi:hypothetical protein
MWGDGGRADLTSPYILLGKEEDGTDFYQYGRKHCDCCLCDSDHHQDFLVLQGRWCPRLDERRRGLELGGRSETHPALIPLPGQVVKLPFKPRGE